MRQNRRTEYQFILRDGITLEAEAGLTPTLCLDRSPAGFITVESARYEILIRNNDLLSTFLGTSVEFVHGQLRTSLQSWGQIEISALYAALDDTEVTAVIPVHIQMSAGPLNIDKILQNMRFAAERAPHAVCRAVAVEKIGTNLLALFELSRNGGEVSIVREHHIRIAR